MSYDPFEKPLDHGPLRTGPRPFGPSPLMPHHDPYFNPYKIDLPKPYDIGLPKSPVDTAFTPLNELPKRNY